MEQYYKLLNVTQYSSLEEIKHSYRDLAKKYHPDVNPNGTEMFVKIKQAYDWLTKNHERKAKKYNKDQMVFYRILRDDLYDQSIEIPIDYVDETVSVILMHRGREGKLDFKKHSDLPSAWVLPKFNTKLTIRHGNN